MRRFDEDYYDDSAINIALKEFIDWLSTHLILDKKGRNLLSSSATLALAVLAYIAIQTRSIGNVNEAAVRSVTDLNFELNNTQNSREFEGMLAVFFTMTDEELKTTYPLQSYNLSLNFMLDIYDDPRFGDPILASVTILLDDNGEVERRFEAYPSSVTKDAPTDAEGHPEQLIWYLKSIMDMYGYNFWENGVIRTEVKLVPHIDATILPLINSPISEALFELDNLFDFFDGDYIDSISIYAPIVESSRVIYRYKVDYKMRGDVFGTFYIEVIKDINGNIIKFQITNDYPSLPMPNLFSWDPQSDAQSINAAVHGIADALEDISDK